MLARWGPARGARSLRAKSWSPTPLCPPLNLDAKRQNRGQHIRNARVPDRALALGPELRLSTMIRYIPFLGETNIRRYRCTWNGAWLRSGLRSPRCMTSGGWQERPQVEDVQLFFRRSLPREDVLCQLGLQPDPCGGGFTIGHLRCLASRHRRRSLSSGGSRRYRSRLPFTGTADCLGRLPVNSAEVLHGNP